MRILAALLLLSACPEPVATDVAPPEPAPASPCDDAEALAAQRAASEVAFEALSDGVDPTPIDRVLDDSGNGTLQVGLQPDAFPLLAGPSGVHAAVTHIGAGRVVAFSGQDFLSSYDRSTLLPDEEVAKLLRNAAAWAGGPEASVLADNQAVADVLTQGTDLTAAVSPIVEVQGLREIRDWSAEALDGHDLAVVQINEWGTLHVADEDLAALEAFVADGGGLLIAGAAAHWSWWLWDQSPEYPGDALLQAHGITWDRTIVGDMTGATLDFDAQSSPEALWCAWVSGGDVDEADLPQVAPLFTAAASAGRDAEVAAGLQRLVDEAPALPASASDPAARLAADVGFGLVGEPWPAPHPWAATFPGAVAADAERTALTAEIDPAWVRDHALGAYAAPGDAVVVNVPAEHVGTGLMVRVGDLHDDLRGLEHIDTWSRAPRLWTEHPVDAESLEIGTGLGGALYLVVPADYPGGSFEVLVENVVPMGVFLLDETEPADFADALAAGAPRAILGSRTVRGVIAAEAAQQADPAAAATFWEGFIASHAALAQEPVSRPYASHWLFDPQVGWGYANATSARINHPELATGWFLRTQTGDEDWWLFGHELGHQFQTSDWSGGDVTEVCVNLWSMYTLNYYLEGGGDFETRGHRNGDVDHAALLDARWGTADLFGKLELYRQLVVEFGWPVFEDVMASYYDPAWPREIYGDFMDGFALRFSAITERDITPFLDRWEYPYSAAARARIQGWGDAEWLPPGW